MSVKLNILQSASANDSRCKAVVSCARCRCGGVLRQSWDTRTVSLNRSSVRAGCTRVCRGRYGRLSRKPASALLHLGPGLANALSNFHNVRRASTPVLHLVGAMASWHKAADPLLNMNVVALAESVSNRVVVTSSADSITGDVRRACTATKAQTNLEGRESAQSTLKSPPSTASCSLNLEGAS